MVATEMSHCQLTAWGGLEREMCAYNYSAGMNCIEVYYRNVLNYITKGNVKAY